MRSSTNRLPGHEVSTVTPAEQLKRDVEVTGLEGQWLYVSEAHIATGLSEKTLRRYIKTERIKVRRLGKLANSKMQLWITPDFLKQGSGRLDAMEHRAIDAQLVDDFYGGTAGEANNSPAAESKNANQSLHSALEMEQILRVVTQQFMEKLEQEKRLTTQLRHELEEKDRQLRLLPDLQRKFEEQQKAKDYEMLAFQNQMEVVLQEKRNILEEASLKAEILRQELEELKAELQRFQRPWWKKMFALKPIND